MDIKDPVLSTSLQEDYRDLTEACFLTEWVRCSDLSVNGLCVVKSL